MGASLVVRISSMSTAASERTCSGVRTTTSLMRCSGIQRSSSKRGAERIHVLTPSGRAFSESCQSCDPELPPSMTWTPRSSSPSNSHAPSSSGLPPAHATVIACSAESMAGLVQVRDPPTSARTVSGSPSSTCTVMAASRPGAHQQTRAEVMRAVYVPGPDASVSVTTRRPQPCRPPAAGVLANAKPWSAGTVIWCREAM